MTAVVDIGNSRIKWALARNGKLSLPGTALHLEDSQQAFASFVAALPADVGRVVATNVAGKEIEALFATAVDERWGLKPDLIEPAAEQLGVTCGYADPRRLGADRWVAVLAAHELASGAACVIDAGTTVTFDSVDAGGEHLGGLIMAGPRLAAAALNRQTSDIGRTAASASPPLGLALLGRNTDDAVAHGTMLSVAAAVDRALTVVAEALATEPLALITGGDAPALLPWLKTAVQYREHLVLEGLALIAARS